MPYLETDISKTALAETKIEKKYCLFLKAQESGHSNILFSSKQFHMLFGSKIIKLFR